MTMIADDPYMHVVPCATPLGIMAYLGDHVVHNPVALLDKWTFMTFEVRCLVDSRERRENKIRTRGPYSAHHFAGDVAVYLEPALNATGEVRARCSDDESGSPSQEIGSIEAAPDHIESRNAFWHELEYRRRPWIEIAIDVAHLEAHIAS